MKLSSINSEEKSDLLDCINIALSDIKDELENLNTFEDKDVDNLKQVLITRIERVKKLQQSIREFGY